MNSVYFVVYSKRNLWRSSGCGLL